MIVFGGHAEDFESYVTGFSSVTPQDFDENMHHEVDGLDNGAREV